jgi:FAD:protein FMN transferase
VSAPEAIERFPCLGSTCAVVVSGGDAPAAAAAARRSLLEWHRRFSRFIPDSELSGLNADPRAEVPVDPLMGRFAAAVAAAAARTGGLVDGTLMPEIEAAGYRGDLRRSLPLALALRLAPPRRPAGPSPAARWRGVAYDAPAGVVRRPPGVALDSGGLAKGLFADVLAETLGPQEAFAVSCAGDLRIGGTAGLPRPVDVQSPFDGSVLHRFEVAAGGVATSGIGRRSWLDARGRPAHHILDPATGRPAFTGVAQATAIAPSALEAEVRAKAALLSGPERAHEWLPDGGVVVRDDGSFVVIAPAAPSASAGRVSGAACPAPAVPAPRSARSAGTGRAGASAGPR